MLMQDKILTTGSSTAFVQMRRYKMTQDDSSLEGL